MSGQFTNASAADRALQRGASERELGKGGFPLVREGSLLLLGGLPLTAGAYGRFSVKGHQAESAGISANQLASARISWNQHGSAGISANQISCKVCTARHSLRTSFPGVCVWTLYNVDR